MPTSQSASQPASQSASQSSDTHLTHMVGISERNFITVMQSGIHIEEIITHLQQVEAKTTIKTE